MFMINVLISGQQVWYFIVWFMDFYHSKPKMKNKFSKKEKANQRKKTKIKLRTKLKSELSKI